jgi:hypothetical protein
MTIDPKKPPSFESVLIDKDEEGRFVLNIASDECGDVKIALSPVVSHALYEVLVNTLSLQIEIDKLAPEEQASFPPEVASNVVRGIGWFKAMAPEALVAQQLNGIFGAGPAQKGN